LTGIALAYFSRTTTERQLAQSSYNDTSSDLLARSALDITVSDLKQEIASNPIVTAANIQPLRYGAPPITDPTPIPNLIRRSFSGDPTGRTSSVSSGAASANGRIISLARWNSHYLIPRASTTNSIDSTPVSSFIAPDWVLVTAQGPKPTPTPSAVIGRYALAVYDEGGLIDMNLGGFPTYAGLTRPTRPARRLAAKYPLEESEIMLAACQAPGFTPDHINASGSTGVPFSITPNTNHNPTSFGPDTLPHGLFVNPITGNIFGIPTSPGSFTVTLSASNGCGTGYGTLNLTIDGLPSPDSTPWPVNLARKGTVAFADVTTLPSTPTVITPTTPAGSMGGFPSSTQINKLMGWRNYATTQQPTSASFDNPSFLLASADSYAKYFLGAALPFTTAFTTVRNDLPGAVVNNRTDQAVMSRQELIKLQRTIGFSQSLLQYLGTFSRETNRPAPDWPQTVAARWDMNYLALAIPDAWIVHPGHSGQGHAWGLQRHTEFAQRFGLVWVNGNFVLGTRFIDPNYYGHWRYIHTLNPLPANSPDFFQIIDYAMNQANGGVLDPNHVRNTFNVGAALIDQYDTDDLYDPDPNPLANGNAGNTITIIDYGGASYAYGIEGMSFDNPIFNSLRPPFAPYPPPAPAGYVLLNRRFENVGEFSYAYNPASTLASKTLDFASSTSHDRALLDLFTYNSASGRAGIVNLNTRNGPVLASIIRGALLNDPGAENTPTVLVSQQDALAAGQAIVQETTNTGLGHGPALTRGDVARLAAGVAAAVPALAASDETKQTIARTLAETGQTRTWNLMIDVIAQTGRYAPGTASFTDANKFTVEGEKRYWLHVALDRDDGTVLGTQLEEVIE
jgi:Putative Ig domain